jgi:hypothetical protein
MNNKHIQIAILNAHNILEVDTNPCQKEFISYLSSPSLNIHKTTRQQTQQVFFFFGKIINSFQTGFMRGRWISDNQAIMDHPGVVTPSRHMVSVLLDQERAYDKVNGKCLELALYKFGFSPSIVIVILSLFHDTRISLSINGWLGSPISQQLELWQDDSHS